MGDIKKIGQKIESSVKKTIKSPERLITKPFEEIAIKPATRALQEVTSFAGSKTVTDALGAVQEFSSTGLGQTAMQGVGGYLGLPNLGNFLGGNQSTSPSPSEVQAPLPSQPVSYSSPVQNNMMLPLLIGGGALLVLVVALRK
jgi:hypothetical protein